MEGEFGGPLWCGGLPLRDHSSYKQELVKSAANRLRTIIVPIVVVVAESSREGIFIWATANTLHALPSMAAYRTATPSPGHDALGLGPSPARPPEGVWKRTATSNEFDRDRRYMKNHRLHSHRHPSHKHATASTIAGGIEPSINGVEIPSSKTWC